MRDLLNAGDFVIITRDGKPPAPDEAPAEIYAVDRDERVLLSRVILKGDALLLLSLQNQQDIEVIHLRGPNTL